MFVHADLLSLDQSKTFYKPDWFDIVGGEVKCCKEAVCIIDMSSFTKFELTVTLLKFWISQFSSPQSHLYFIVPIDVTITAATIYDNHKNVC